MNADSLYFNGKAFVRKANLGIRPLNTVYTIEGQTIDFNKDGFEFNDVVLKDKFGNIGTLKGYIHHEKFNNFDLNLAIKTGRLMVLNTVQKTDNPFYGDAYVSGDVAIFGNMDKLYFAGNNLRTERGTKFCLPINFADKVSDSDVITFKTRPSDDRDNEPVEKTAETSKMEMDFNFILDVTNAADILLDLDLSAFGGSIKTSGDGRLHFTSSHLFLDLAFEYEEWADYGAFLDSVRFRADLRTSTFDMGTLQYFATATRGMDDTLVVSCKVNGPVNDLHVTDLKANLRTAAIVEGCSSQAFCIARARLKTSRSPSSNARARLATNAENSPNE